MLRKATTFGFLVLAGLAAVAGGPGVESQRMPYRWGPAPVPEYERLSGGVANVMEFGAVGDGFADDSVPIQAAIDALSDSGGTVIFPAGRYRVLRQLSFPNDGAPANTRQPPYVLEGTGALFDGHPFFSSGGSTRLRRMNQLPSRTFLS